MSTKKNKIKNGSCAIYFSDQRHNHKRMGILYIEGAKGVGRLALYNRLRWGAFDENGYSAPCDPTARLICKVDGQDVVYDLMTQSDCEELRDLGRKNVAGFILVYSVDLPESLEKLAKAVQEIAKIRQNDNFPFVVANKTDLDHNKSSLPDGAEFAKRHNVPFIEVSCRDNTRMDEILPPVIREVLKKLPGGLTVWNTKKEKERCILC